MGLIPQERRNWRLALDDLVLAEPDPVWHPDGYRITTQARDFSTGSPVPMWVAVPSLLQDGELRGLQRHNNREFGWFTTVEGKDGRGLALGVQALELRLGKRTKATWLPPDPTAAVAVFDVEASSAEEADGRLDDMAELRNQMTLRLKFEALPFVHTVDPVTVSFSTGAASVSVVDDATSTANWSAGQGASGLTQMTYQGASAVRVTSTVSDRGYYGWWAANTVRFSGAIPAAPFVVVDVATSAPLKDWPSMVRGDRWPLMIFPEMQLVARDISPEGTGYQRYWFRNPGGSALPDGVTFLAPVSGTEGSTQYAYVARIGTANNAPNSGTLAAPILGSQRTPASLVLTGGGANAVISQDPSYITNGWSPTSNQQNAPDGVYTWYYLGPLNAGDVITITDTQGSGSAQKVRVQTTGYRWHCLGQVAMGGNRDGRVGANGLARYAVSYSGGAFPPSGYTAMFRKHESCFHSLFSGLTKSRLVVDIPSLERPRGGIWEADNADLSDATSVWHLMPAMEWPSVAPPQAAFWLGSDASSRTFTATYYPAFGFRVVEPLP